MIRVSGTWDESCRGDSLMPAYLLSVLYFTARCRPPAIFQHCNRHRDTVEQSRSREGQFRWSEVYGRNRIPWYKTGPERWSPCLHRVKVMWTWTYSKTEGDKGKILSRSVTWFDWQPLKDHSGCLVGNRAAGAEQGWEGQLQADAVTGWELMAFCGERLH